METYLPLWGFIAVMVGTPGPANMLIMSAGAQCGYVRSLPFLLGLIIGKLLLNIAVSFGLAAFLFKYPLAVTALSVLSASYMVFLAARGWTPAKDDAGAKRVLGLPTGMIVHPLNPKAWTMATLAVTQFSANYAAAFEKYLLVPLSFVVAQLVFHSLWCVAGALLKKTLAENILLHRALILLTMAVILWAMLR